MKKTDYRLLEEAYTQTQPTPRMVLEAQLQETIEIINEGMWDRLKSDVAGAKAGLGRKALGTVGRAATLGVGGRLNPFNHMVASGRQAGQEARAGSIGKSHQVKLQKVITGVTGQFNNAIDAYIADMERQKLIAPNSVSTQTAELKLKFSQQLQHTQGQINQLVQTATGMTAAGAGGKTVGGMDQQQVGGATAGGPGLGSAINKNIIQPTKQAVLNAPKTAAAATRKVMQKPGQVWDDVKKGWKSAAPVPVPEAIEPEDWDAAEEEDKEGSEDPDFQAQKMATAEAKDKAKGIMDRKGKNVKKENTSPLDIELPYTHLHESNTQSYADNMVQGWRSRLT